MKLHITNLYGFVKNKNIAQAQRSFAEVAGKIDFYEMGIFVYNVASDSPSELSKRLDGIIAAVERNDTVIVQLPTGNGQLFEERLLQKISAYSGRKTLAIWHNIEYYTVNHARYANWIDKDFISNVEEVKSEFEIQKILLDMLSDNSFTNYNDNAVFPDDTDNMIHIGFGLYDKNGNYSVWVGTVMQSIVEHTDAKMHFHILHDTTLTEDNRNKLNKVARDSGNNISFHLFDSEKFADVEELMGHFTIGTMFRTMLPEILPDLSRIIYLDADLFVNRDIEELWNTDISNYCLAAVRDSGTILGNAHPYPVSKNQVLREEYFNAGVIYFNLDNIRKSGNMHKLVIDYLKKNPGVYCPDQDALNVIYRGKCLYLENSWNSFISEMRKAGNTSASDKIYHYAGALFALHCQNEVEQLFFETILRTPWGRVMGRRQIERSMNRLWDKAEQLKALLHTISSQDKQYIFYGEMSQSMRKTMELLNVHYESCIQAEHFEGLNLSEVENAIIFVLPQADNGHAIEKLEQHKLKNGEDFFVIPRLISHEYGGYIL